MLPHSWVWPQRLVHITGTVFPCQAPREETPRAPHPSLNRTHINFATWLFHSLHKRCAHKGLPLVSPTPRTLLWGFRNAQLGGRYCTRSGGGVVPHYNVPVSLMVCLSDTLWWEKNAMERDQNVRIWAVVYGLSLA